MSNTYPFAPLKPREIPALAMTAAVERGIDLHAKNGAHGCTEEYRRKLAERCERSAEVTYQLEKRLEADMRQLEHGPLEAVAR